MEILFLGLSSSDQVQILLGCYTNQKDDTHVGIFSLACVLMGDNVGEQNKNQRFFLTPVQLLICHSLHDDNLCQLSFSYGSCVNLDQIPRSQ